MKIEKKYIYSFIFLFAFLGVLFSQTFYIPPLVMTASEDHTQILVDVKSTFYDENSAKQLFLTMDEKSEDVCNILYKNKKYDIHILRNYIREFSLKKKDDEKWFDRLIPSLYAGCFNFFQMNDVKVKKTFSYLSERISGLKDCYSVGFMQPYIMHSTLNCTTLTMLDMNWKILFGHLEMYRLFKNESIKLSDEGLIDPGIISNIPVSWTAVFGPKPRPKERNININSFCSLGDLEDCNDSLISYQSMFSNINRIELQLSTLTYSDIRVKTDKTVIVYLSNAIDPEYTTYTQFKMFLDKLSKNLYANQKAYLIYQAGGRSLSAIYLLEKYENEEVSLSTVCRDKLIWSEEYKNRGKPYKIYLDRYTTSKNPVACSLANAN